METSMMKDKEEISGKLLRAIVATGLLSFLGVLSETAMNVTFPTLMQEFGVNTSTVQWLTTGYLLLLSLIVPLSSFFIHRFHMRSLFITANILFTAATLLCALAPVFHLLILGRILQGVAVGISLPLMFNIVLNQAPKSHIGMLMGVASVITAIAPALGPVLGGVIVTHLSWRVIFWCLLPVLLISLALGMTSIEQSTETSKIKFNIGNYLFIALSFIAFIFAIEEASNYGWTSIRVLSLFGVTLVTLIIFVILSKRSNNPVIHLEVFGYAPFLFGLAYILIIQFSVLALGYIIPNYSQFVWDTKPSVAGMLLFPGCVVGAIMTFIAGRLLDRFGAVRPIIVGCSAIIISMMLFKFCDTYTTLIFIIYYVVFTFGQGLTIGNTMTFSLGQLPASLSSDGNAVLNTLQQLAGAVGTAVATSIIGASQEEMENLRIGAINGGDTVFTLLAFLSVIALISILCMFRKKSI